MRTLDEKQKYGLKVIGSMMGEGFAEKLKAGAEGDAFGSDISRMALNFAFADGWGHTGIDRKSKSIAIISALIAMKQTKEMKNHIKVGLANGLTAKDIEALMVQLTPYVGFPCISSALTGAIEALREAGLDLNVKTPEEKGML